MSNSPSWAGVTAVALGVVQTVLLAYISSRSKRVRRGDQDQAQDDS